MKIAHYESKPEKQPLSSESRERLRLINDTNEQLEDLPDFNLETTEGRLGVKVALDLIFSNIDKIEGDVFSDVNGEKSQEERGFEVVGSIRDRIRDLYQQLYALQFPDNGDEQSKATFYSEIKQIMEMIEQRGERFIVGLEEYQSLTEENKSA